MVSNPIEFTVSDGIARIIMDAPENRNAVTARFAEEFSRCTRIAASDRTVKVIVLTGTGDFFSPGGDIAEFLGAGDQIDQHIAYLTDHMHAGTRHLASANAPVVIGLNGMAAGGGFGLVLSGDYVIARRSARLNCGYTRSGLTPDAGTTWFLPRIVGHARAFEIAAMNEMITADEAQHLGIVNKVADDPEFAEALEAVVARFAAMPAGSLGTTKRLLRQAESRSLEAHLEVEAEGIRQQVRSAETLAVLNSFASRSKRT
jgi:2-(1,2-epoxy-1,2-dihydrophenyl)acetyl-CoA isomerase